MSATRVVKIFGERNTGTRAMARLLGQIPGVVFRAGPRPEPTDGALEAAIEMALKGPWKRLYLHALRDQEAARLAEHDPWKHAVPRLTPALVEARAGIVVMLRDPYSWLIGLARRPYHLKGPPAAGLEAFVHRPWMTEAREGLPAVVASPVDLWGLKVAASFAFLEAAQATGLPTALVQFETFVQDPAASAKGVAKDLDLPAADISAPTRNTKEGEADLQALQRYYGEERWTDWLTAPLVAAINARLDPELVAAAGYRMRAPDPYPETLESEVADEIRRQMSALGNRSDRG